MLRLLIIEDDESAAELTLRSLSAAGLSCALDRVGTEVEFRSALARTPDLILSDSNVPGFDGMAALTIAKAEQPAIPFIFVSGHMSDSAMRRARAGGATECLTKSELQRLPRIVRSVLNGRVDAARGSARGRRVLGRGVRSLRGRRSTFCNARKCSSRRRKVRARPDCRDCCGGRRRAPRRCS